MTIPYAEVIGDPIAHSKSPLIHGFWLAGLGIEAEYRKTHVRADGLAGYFAERRRDRDWRGCNVTVPHKQSVLPHLDDCSDTAKAIGAVNTIVNRDGRLIGHNTDVAGFIQPLQGIVLSRRPVAVVGAGGAARAVLAGLQGLGVGRVTLLNRSAEKAAALAAAFPALGVEVRPLESQPPPVALLVNATALGMIGQPAFSPDLSALPDDALVYDIVYAPLETPLLAAAKARGLRTIDGLAMLIGQAAIAFQHFFGALPEPKRDSQLRALLTA